METRNSRPEIKAAIFDVDGTLLDSMYVWSSIGDRFLASLQIQSHFDLGERLFPMSLKDSAQYLKNEYQLPMTEEEIRQRILEIVRIFYEEEAPIKPGVRSLLETLKQRGIPMVIATSSSRALVEAALRRLQIWEYFDCMFTCDEVGAGKQEPLIYQKAAEYLQVPPENTYVFEDVLFAIHSAGTAGFTTVGIYDEVSREQQDAIRQECSIYVHSLEEVRFF